MVKEFGAKAVGPNEIYGVDADIFAPCALGAILNDDTLKVLKVDIVVGGANNQLAEPRHAKEVEAKGILYGPDYLVNAGGLINVYAEIQGWPAERSLRKAGEIYNTLIRILELAEAEGITTAEAADKVAEQRMEDVRLSASDRARVPELRQPAGDVRRPFVNWNPPAGGAPCGASAAGGTCTERVRRIHAGKSENHRPRGLCRGQGRGRSPGFSTGAHRQ